MIDWWLSIFALFIVLIPPYDPEDIFRLLSTYFDSHETDLFLIVQLKNLKVWKKYELEKTMKFILSQNCHFLMKYQYCQKYCHFQKFSAKKCHKFGKHLPYFLSTIWQPRAGLV